MCLGRGWQAAASDRFINPWNPLEAAENPRVGFNSLPATISIKSVTYMITGPFKIIPDTRTKSPRV
jgi:hypothetical protein